MIINYPLETKKISTPFGQDFGGDPIYGDFYTLFDNKHCGVDFEVPVGTTVYASFDGIVVQKEFHKGMGNVVGVRNGNIVALCAHLSEFSVDLGDIVFMGSLIGLSGSTGDACPTPHLHFEVRDISKKRLKDMVFDPPFGKEIKQYKTTFIYKVNNVNTKKTLLNLSKLYFGVPNYWKEIKELNNLQVSRLKVLEQGLEIEIPSFDYKN
ncbi:M23 family metallopeptidase [Patescibacteria group bacterium]|nr:M23 family metallopeptidase [Patescibacteria group bacterium]